MKKTCIFLALICLMLSACSLRKALPGDGQETPAREISTAAPLTTKTGEPGPVSSAPAAGETPAIGEGTLWTPPPVQTGSPPDGGQAEWTPIPAAPAIPENDTFLQRMRSEGYTLAQSGSLTDARGGIYSAYVFTKFDFGEPVGASTFIIGFYRLENGVNRFLNSLSPAAYTEHIPVYPSFYRLANWDNPQMSLIGLSAVPDWDAEIYQALRLQGFSADINTNGRPEFILAGEYCPIACSNTALGFDVFEVQDDGRVVDLADGLPGRIRLPGIRLNPPAFDAGDAYWYGDGSQIILPFIVGWDGARFAETTEPARAELLSQIQELADQLKASYGQRILSEESQANALNILFGYEQLGMRQEGLQAFLAATDLANWDTPNRKTQCWLQVARARAQQEYEQNIPFSLPPSLNASLGLYPALSLSQLAKPLAGTFDVSACR